MLKCWKPLSKAIKQIHFDSNLYVEEKEEKLDKQSQSSNSAIANKILYFIISMKTKSKEVDNIRCGNVPYLPRLE